MTTRQRFNMLMNGDASIDCLPCIEWAGWWNKTLEVWHEQGLACDIDAYEIADFLKLDYNTQFWLSHKTEDCPKDVTHGSGIIKSIEDYKRLRPYLLPENAVQQIIPQINKIIPMHEKGDTIVWYTVEGFFWWPRVLLGIEDHLYSFYDQPELYHMICEDLLAWQIARIDELASFVKADFMTIAEDMSYNHGCMISEDLFNTFIKPYYQRLIPEIKKHGTKVFVDSDGDITHSIPWFVGAGVEGILPLERQSGVDVAAIRQEYPNFLMIGGFDKMTMLDSPEAVKREIERLLPVIRSGRFLPSMDHQTPPGTQLSTYAYYVKMLREYAQYACKDCLDK